MPAAHSELWPLTDLVIDYGQHSLSLPTPDQMRTLIRVRAREVSEIDGLNPRLQEFALLQGELRATAEWLPDNWRLSLCVSHRGVPVGFQALMRTRHESSVSTDSWVSPLVRNTGHGTAARIAVLLFAQRFLGIGEATGRSWEENLPSNALNRKLGYSEIGRSTTADDPREEILWSLDLLRWDPPGAETFHISGLSEEAKFLLGVRPFNDDPRASAPVGDQSDAH
jgi:RimJ/RimL family protein N-acetyltransferase